MREAIQIEGVPLHIIDTAGLRETGDAVEKIGIARTWAAVDKAAADRAIAEQAAADKVIPELEKPGAKVYRETEDPSSPVVSVIRGSGMQEKRTRTRVSTVGVGRNSGGLCHTCPKLDRLGE